jgi:hypothetical protein
VLLKDVAPIDANMYVERKSNHEKTDFMNRRHILLCDNCYWCLSYLPDLENDTIQYFHNCPKCHKNIRGMYISEQASRQFDEKDGYDMSENEELLVA